MIFHDPPVSDRASGLFPLVQHTGASMITYACAWSGLQARSWTLGQAVRSAGRRYYGSAWNYLLPVVDDLRLARSFRASGAQIAHFLWGEFASPPCRGLYRSARALIGTFHASVRKLPDVLKRPARVRVYDFITLMSATQKPFFLEAGIPENRMRVILHGVDTGRFVPGAAARPAEGPLRGLMVGSTERDHDFLAAVARGAGRDVLRLVVVAPAEQLAAYRGADNVELRDRVPFAELLRLYQESDLLVMPLHDATANNALLEAMACGTPVMTNRVGGVPEYVDPACSALLDGKRLEEWIDRLRALALRRDTLAGWRAGARAGAERFEWKLKAAEYMQLYAEATGAEPCAA